MKGGTLLMEFVTTVVVVVFHGGHLKLVGFLDDRVGSVGVSSGGIFHITNKTICNGQHQMKKQTSTVDWFKPFTDCRKHTFILGKTKSAAERISIHVNHGCK